MTKDFDELEYWRSQLRGGIHGKDTKAYILRELIAAANRRGIIVPGYNSSEFAAWLNEPIDK
jgi:hypothetical protein